MRLIDADKVPPLSDLRGCAYEGGEYQAYKSGAEYGRGLVDDTPTIDPESVRPTAHWISVKDRLPDVFDEVLVYFNGFISIAWRETEKRKNGIVGWHWDSQMSYPESLVYVTHWMPLPEPPTKGE